MLLLRPASPPKSAVSNMRKSIKREFEENSELDLLDDVIRSLNDGARKSGVTLTKSECETLLKRLSLIPSKGRPKWLSIARFSFAQEIRIGSTKAAVGDTMHKFGVKEATVWDARRRLYEHYKYANQIAVASG
jgi:hypothetical protein